MKENTFVKCTVPQKEVTRVKALGFLRDKTTEDKFNARVITQNGMITAKESKAIADAAEKFGNGKIVTTTRLTIEIQGVPYDNIDALIAFLKENGLETGGTGAKVRPVVSCKGTTCIYGLIDTFSLSKKIHEKFYKGYNDEKLPHKFKIAVGGCPNNCVKPNLNDLGVMGQRVPNPDYEKCKNCKKCIIEAGCPMKAAKVVDGKINIDTDECNHCGRCFKKCPFKVFEKNISGYRIYIGGRWGKKTARAKLLDKVFTDEDEVLDVVERAICLFRDEGVTGERFADTIERLGFDYVQSKLLGEKIKE